MPMLGQCSACCMQVLSTLKALAAEALGADIAADVPLMSAGLDSLGAMELRNGVSTKFGVSLPATVAFDFPTLKVLSALHNTGQSTLATVNLFDISAVVIMHLLTFISACQAMAEYVAARVTPKDLPLHAQTLDNLPRMGTQHQSGAASAASAALVLQAVQSVLTDVLGTAVLPEQPLMQVRSPVPM